MTIVNVVHFSRGPNTPTGGTKMICPKCLQDLDISKGRTYSFYYGIITHRTLGGNTVTTRYQMSGKEETFLCNTCVFTYAMSQRAAFYRIGAVIGAIVACPVMLIALLLSNGSAFLGGGLILACAFVLFQVAGVVQKRVENQHFAHLSNMAQDQYGSQLATSVCKADFRRRGYDQLFTPQAIKRLKKPISIP